MCVKLGGDISVSRSETNASQLVYGIRKQIINGFMRRFVSIPSLRLSILRFKLCDLGRHHIPQNPYPKFVLFNDAG